VEDNLANELFVISGPSGVGKSIVVKAVLQACPKLRLTLSHTTRKPRPGETPGVQYNFVSDETFRGMISRDEFVEWAYYPRDSTNMYGTSRQEILGGGNKLLEIETQGARKIKTLYPKAVLIFIWAEGTEVKKRMVERGGLSEAQMTERLAVAEIETIEARGFFDHFIENADGPNGLQKAVLLVRNIVNT
jgi:guanylate kinase